MARQSKLEKIAIDKRDELEVKLDYRQGAFTEYDENHPDAISDGDVLGKGAPSNSEAYIPIGDEKSTLFKNTINIEKGGGKYDIKGTEGVDKAFQGKSGREYLMSINKYRNGDGCEYGENSVDTSANVLEHGQIVIR